MFFSGRRAPCEVTHAQRSRFASFANAPEFPSPGILRVARANCPHLFGTPATGRPGRLLDRTLQLNPANRIVAALALYRVKIT